MAAPPIYLDYQATTPLAPEAFAAMVPWLRDQCANPHSAHRMGREAAAVVELARDAVAALLPAGGRVIFTSGATEAINLAIFGTGRKNFAAPVSEHAAVLDCLAALPRDTQICYAPVDASGLVAPADLHASRGLIAAMLVNNEIGTIQPIAAIAAQAQAQGALMLCDAVQAFGRVPIPAGPDLIAISAHKMHGPKGIGALWVRDGVDLRPILHGGGQEQGLRSGTLSPALCAGFGVAAQLGRQQMAADYAHVERLAALARSLFADWTINGSVDHRYPGNLNLRRDGVDVARLLSELRGVAFSAGSACASGSGRPSHVLQAIGLNAQQAKNAIRIGFGRYSSEAELRSAAESINRAAEAQR